MEVGSTASFSPILPSLPNIETLFVFCLFGGFGFGLFLFLFFFFFVVGWWVFFWGGVFIFVFWVFFGGGCFCFVCVPDNTG